MPPGSDERPPPRLEDAAASRPGVSEAARPGPRSTAGGSPPSSSPSRCRQFTYADLLATVDGLTARKKALAERISELATDPAWWPTVARLRAFRGVDTLTALAIHLELGADWARFEKPTRVGSWLGLTPSRQQSGESDRHGSITKTGSMLARRLLVESAWQYAREPRIGVTLANRQDGQPDHVLQIANRAQQRLHHLYTEHARPRQAAQRDRRRGRPRAVVLPLGRRDRTLTQRPHRTQQHPAQEAGTPGRHSGRHARNGYEQHPHGATLVPRPAHRRQQQQGHGVSQNPRISDWQRRHRARRPALLRHPQPPAP